MIRLFPLLLYSLDSATFGEVGLSFGGFRSGFAIDWLQSPGAFQERRLKERAESEIVATGSIKSSYSRQLRVLPGLRPVLSRG